MPEADPWTSERGLQAADGAIILAVMTPKLPTDAYSKVILIDTQVVLEARPLDQLPWSEIDPGPILLLVCPQVASEIDAKKRDGRLGNRSRAFNRLLEAFIATRSPATVTVGPVRVDVALTASTRIDWEALDDLDRDNADDRIVGQALHALVDHPSRIEVLSHDMRPRDAAARHGLTARRLPDEWLLPPEPSPHERRMRELAEENRILRENQPRLRAAIDWKSPPPFRRLSVTPLDEQQVQAAAEALQRRHPAPLQLPHYAVDPGHDFGHRDRHGTWLTRLLRDDLPMAHAGLARLLSQHVVSVTVSNVGEIAAADLSVEITCRDATVHAAPFLVSVFGPPAPKPISPFNRALNMPTFKPAARHDPFAFYDDVEGPGEMVSWSCTDFRQGRDTTFDVSIDLHGTTAAAIQIEVRLTCSNMKGDLIERTTIPVEDVQQDAGTLVDPSKPALLVAPSFTEGMTKERFADLVRYRNDGTRRTR